MSFWLCGKGNSEIHKIVLLVLFQFCLFKLSFAPKSVHKLLQLKNLDGNIFLNIQTTKLRLSIAQNINTRSVRDHGRYNMHQSLVSISLILASCFTAISHLQRCHIQVSWCHLHKMHALWLSWHWTPFSRCQKIANCAILQPPTIQILFRYYSDYILNNIWSTVWYSWYSLKCNVISIQFIKIEAWKRQIFLYRRQRKSKQLRGETGDSLAHWAELIDDFNTQSKLVYSLLADRFIPREVNHCFQCCIKTLD